MTDDRVSLFFMDYANKTRLKLFGRATIVDPDDQTTLSRLEVPDYRARVYRARVERGLLITVAGFDWNCPQHITERFTRDEVMAVTEAQSARIAELEAELAQRVTAPAGEIG